MQIDDALRHGACLALACLLILSASASLLSFRTSGMQSIISLSPACFLVDFVAMLVACATSVLIGAIVGPVTGSLKHL